MKKTSTLFSLLLLATAFSGCVSTLPINYAPSSTLSASGSVSVVPFAYAPAESRKVDPNQIRNTAMGSIHFEQNIDVIFRDAVFKELRFVGVKVDDPTKKLSGTIVEFLIDDLGYSVDWTLTVKYRVTSGSDTVYERVKEIKRKTAKFANVFGALNETIKLNIEELIKDPDFVSAIK
jgi:uncharacterized lipoprotein